MPDHSTYVPSDAEPSLEIDRALFKNKNFVRLWSAQVVSSLGDWIGIFAIISLASSMAGIGGVGWALNARLVPGLIFAPVAGVLVDRWDRRRTMIVCDLLRAGLYGLLPFVNSIGQLVLLSLLLEFVTLVWTPAKEALVPNMVGRRRLLGANSLSLVAAYGTMPLGAIVTGILTWGVFAGLAPSSEHLALWVDSFTFLVAAGLVWSIHLPYRRPSGASRRGLDMGETWREVSEGVQFMRSHPVVRIVMIGMATALLGGAMIVPLGKIYAEDALAGDGTGYFWLQAGIGLGAIIGILLVNRWSRATQRSRLRVFTYGLLICGVALFAVATVGSIWWALLSIVVFGIGAGTAYTTGITLLQQTAADDIRGRVFAALNTIIRVSLLASWVFSPLLASAMGEVAGSLFPDGTVSLPFGIEYPVNGVRIVLWGGAALLLAVGLWARKAVGDAAATIPDSPTGEIGVDGEGGRSEGLRRGGSAVGEA